MKILSRNQLTKSITMALAGSVVAATVVSPAMAQDDDSALLEEVIVTAQKRTQNLQDVAVSVQVLGNEQLENLGVRGFEDFIAFLPTVSYTSAGPGYAQIYMRGIASGGDGNHSASMPSVGYYLDEQPITTIAQVLDIHMYDIARVETLSGPQGTLYGQGSQSGTIRIITNKPIIGEREGGYDVEVNSVKSGDVGYNLDGFINIPIGDNAAVRIVGWHVDQAGYIDLVPTTMNFPGPQPGTADNFDFAREDHNTVKTSGFRALLKVDLNENWSITPGLMYQTSDIDGEWAHNPEFFGDLKTGKLWDSYAEDEWYQATLTVEGSIGDIDVIYAGAYLDRDNQSEYDYSDYTEYWAYYLTNPEEYDAPGYCVYYDADSECALGTQFVGAFEKYKRESHELRFQSSPDNRLRWIAGLFYQKQEHNFDLQWIVPDLDPDSSVVVPPTGDRKYGGATVWQTYQIREDQDTAAFGEITFDITDKFTALVGARYFEYENSLYGFNGFARHCTGQYIDGEFVEIPAEDGGELQQPCFDTRVLDDVAEGDDWAFKGNLEYRHSDDTLFYVTWSEGFRAGGVNRARVEGIPKYDPDFVTNYEFGWKTTLAGGSVRFNGAVYIVDWDNFQFGFLNFAVSNLTIVQNVGNAQTKGVEWDLAWAVNDGNTLTFAGSYNDSTLQTDFWLEQEDEEAGLSPDAPAGTPMPYVPEWQLTGVWRSTFDVAAMPAFFQAAASYTGSRWNDLEVTNVPARQNMDSYTLVNLSAGIEKENWTLTFFVNNLFDERAEIDIFDPGYGGLPNLERPPGHAWTTVTNRPRTFGIRFGQRF
jgi:iron complex outermembrane receptor protein